ncbi:MAG: hypothetical protein K0S44_517 [Bacteroidetes bacterium]|jgi:putative SOS response-associated peptidase YedK|nr:hypothetical protein [Bacteroidota bacterium]
MCYTISYKNKDEKKLAKALGPAYPSKVVQLKTVYAASGFTNPEWPVITSGNPNEFQLFNWGLIPKWTPGIDLAKEFRLNNLNAKSETIFEKRSFSGPVKKQRCLIPVTGFFEWRDINKKKYPYHIHLKDEEVFCLGGIYDEWADKTTGEIINTFSIVTTAANPLMAKIHNLKLRMPLILPKEKLNNWLQPDLSEEEITGIMKPFDGEQMAAHTISKRITSRTENPDSPETLAPFEYPELQIIDLME